MVKFTTMKLVLSKLRNFKIADMFANPELTMEKDLHQPSVFNGVLKAYQLKVGIYVV